MSDSTQHRNDGLALRTYIKFSNKAAPLLQRVLKRRLAKGKEDPVRYTEKLSITDVTRPDGELIWMHGVGLGEVLALRGLIQAIANKQPEINFLVTSSTRASAEVFNSNKPDNTIHQFLPIDTKPQITSFLDHWQPDLSLWAEQDLWPALVFHTHTRSIPLVLLNARMNTKSYRSRARLSSLYKDLYSRFEWISAQDANTAENMNKLGANATVGGSLKTATVALTDNVEIRESFERDLNSRTCWLVASSHQQDEALALQAHVKLLVHQPDALLIIAPRIIDRKAEIITAIEANNLKVSSRSNNEPVQQCNVYLADSFGEMGLWYRLCACAFIGGSMSDVQGHNPWEAAVLGCAIVHGPNTENFQHDYQTLQQHNAATRVTNADQLLQALTDTQRINRTASRAKQLVHSNSSNVTTLANRVLDTLASHKAA